MQPIPDIPPLSPNDIDQALEQITSEEQRVNFRRNLELDFGYTISNVGRIRCNAAKQRGTTSLVIRLLPSVVPSIEELGLPEVCKELVLKRRGLVVVSGPTGSGKSTTLSAMIHYLNGVEGRRVGPRGPHGLRIRTERRRIHGERRPRHGKEGQEVGGVGSRRHRGLDGLLERRSLAGEADDEGRDGEHPELAHAAERIAVRLHADRLPDGLSGGRVQGLHSHRDP